MVNDETQVYTKLIKFDNREKIIFKFVINGEWKVSPDYKIVTDETGNENNYIDADELVELQEFEVEDEPVVAPVPVPVLPAEKSKSESAEPSDLSNVSTRGSSFAAVLIPSGNDHSAFEEIDQTPTTSLINSQIINPAVEEKDTSTITSVSNSSIEPPAETKAKKENLVSKFKGLFKY